MRVGIAFDEIELEKFFRFIHERHSIWNRRFIQQLPRSEWTQDPILQKNKFTNVYRELDPGTQYAMRRILERDIETATREDIVFNDMLYRLMCSIPTYEGWGFRGVGHFDQAAFELYLSRIYESGDPVFGNAYLISPYSSMGQTHKFQNVSKLFGLVQEAFMHEGFFGRLDSAPTFEKAWGVINSLYGFGPFLAYQVMVDLTYSLPNTEYESAILPLGQNDWARLGPGAMRGLNRMTTAPGQPAALHALRWIWGAQHELFSEYDLEFPYLVVHRKDGTSEQMAISLANFQNCCCEFHKYRSIQDGTGKAQRLFVPSIRGAKTGRIRFDPFTGRYQ